MFVSERKRAVLVGKGAGRVSGVKRRGVGGAADGGRAHRQQLRLFQLEFDKARAGFPIFAENARRECRHLSHPMLRKCPIL